MTNATLTTKTIPHWVDNAPFFSGPTQITHHPNTGTPLPPIHSATLSECDIALTSCQAAFPSWSTTPPTERRSILLKAAALLRERGDVFKQVWQSEIHADDFFVEFNVETSAGMIEECAANITTALMGDVVQDIDRERWQAIGCWFFS